MSKKHFKTFIALFIALFVFYACENNVYAAANYGVTPVTYTLDDLDYDELANLTGLTQEQTRGLCEAYAKLFSGESSYECVFDLGILSSSFGVYEARIIQEAVGTIYPYEFNITKYGLSYSTSSSYIYGVALYDSYDLSDEERTSRIDALKTSVNDIFNSMPQGMSDIETAVWIHNYLVLNSAYDYDNYLAGTIPYTSYCAYGTIVNQLSVCEGYSYAYAMLLKMCGIPAITVTGTANGGSHAWNEIQLDGKWYCVDITWDDPVPDSPGIVKYGYLFLTDSELAADHVEASASNTCTDTLFSDWFAHSIRNLTYSDGWWYFVSDNSLIQTDIMGTNQTVIMDNVSAACVYNGYIFYADGWNIMAKNIETGDITQVITADTTDVTYVEPYVSVSGYTYSSLKAYIGAISISGNTISYSITDYVILSDSGSSISYSYSYIANSSELPEEYVVTDTVKNGLVTEADGKTYYYVDGVVNTDYAGVVYSETDDCFWMVENGVVVPDYEGLAYSQYDDNFWVIEEGKVNFDFVGLIYSKYDGNFWATNGGRVDFSYTGVVYSKYDGNFYMAEDGKVNFEYEGMAYSPYDGNFYILENGIVNFNYNGVSYSPYDGNFWAVQGGMVLFGYTGIMYSPYDGNIWYVYNGIVDFSYTGNYSVDGITYNVINGLVQ